MAPFICCGSDRQPSPDAGPICLVDGPQIQSRFPVSVTEPSQGSVEADVTIPKSFEAAASGEAQGGSFQATDLAEREGSQNLRRRESMKSIHGIRKRMRKTGSAISRHSSKLSLRSSISNEDSQRHRELKKLLHRRVAASHQNNWIASEGEYDEDAVPIKTPRGSWGREHDAAIQNNLRSRSMTLERSPSPLLVSNPRTDRRDFYSRRIVPRSATSTLSRMLTVRGSQTSGNFDSDKVPNEAEVGRETSEARNSSNAQKYIFRDDSRSPQKPSARTPSPLGRSDTVIRIPSSSAVVDLGQPSFLDIVDAEYRPHEPNTELQSIASEHDSNMKRKRCLSYVPSRDALDHLQVPKTMAEDEPFNAIDDIRRPSIGSRPSSWNHGMSGLFERPNNQDERRNDNSAFAGSTSHGGQYISTKEKGRFGEFDYADPSIYDGELRDGQDTWNRKESSGSNSVHLYDMRIPQRLASQNLLQSISQPLLQGSSTSKGHALTHGYNFTGDKTRRRASSSDFHSGNAPIPWGLAKKSFTPSIYSQDAPKPYATSSNGSNDGPKTGAASSIYSQQSLSMRPTESLQSSITFLNAIADRMNRFGPDAPARDIISVPAANNKQVDLNKIEQRTRETSFNSSNESLYRRELAAAATRIVPRAKTVKLPKSSWFKEDFDDVAAAIAASNPRRRSVSERLHRKPNLSSYDGNQERHLSIRPRADRFSFIARDDEDGCVSVWEKALHEHSLEDAAISRTRAGSDAMDDRKHLIPRHHHHREPPHHRHIIDRFSPSHREGEILQAKLDAFQLPSPPRKRTPTDELKPILTPSSRSSWTRYSSHDREERSSTSAGEADDVFARDFAEEAASAARMMNQAAEEIDPIVDSPVAREDDKGSKKSKRMTFSSSALTKLRKLYRAGSLEFVSRTAFGSRGHRSSVSEGWSIEYPELEMLPPRSPVVDLDLRELTPVRPSQNVFSQRKTQSEGIARIPSPVPTLSLDGADSVSSTGFRLSKDEGRESSPQGAKRWSNMYVEDCVTYPTNSPPQTSLLSQKVAVEGIPSLHIEIPEVEESWKVNEYEDEHEQYQHQNQRHSAGDGDSSEHDEGTCSPSNDGMRSSTLDFHRRLEGDERRARARVLGLTMAGMAEDEGGTGSGDSGKDAGGGDDGGGDDGGGDDGGGDDGGGDDGGGDDGTEGAVSTVDTSKSDRAGSENGLIF